MLVYTKLDRKHSRKTGSSCYCLNYKKTQRCVYYKALITVNHRGCFTVQSALKLKHRGQYIVETALTLNITN